VNASLVAGALRGLLRATGRLSDAQIPDLAPLLHPERRVVEVGASGFPVASALRARGHRRLLALSLEPDAAAFARLRESHPELGTALVRCADARWIGNNSAETLVLSDAQALARLTRHRHARHVLFAAPAGLAGARAALDFARRALAGSSRGLHLLGPAAFRDAAGRERLVLVTENRGRKPETARRFVPSALGIEGFFRALEARGVRYAILRWFEALPELPPGEDLDLLVADDDVAAVEEILGAGPGLVPLDLYSASGLPGTAFRRMACYPPAVAERILADAVVPRAPYRVPSPRHHFLSLAYHAVYHKGEASGLPSDEPGVATEPAPDHDYAGVLAGLAGRLGIRAAIRLEALDAQLAAEGWRPPLDTLARLARRNRWLASRVARLVAEREGAAPPGLAVFLVRRRAVELGLAAEIESLLAQEGFEILARVPLATDASARVAGGARGGNWERGPYPRSAGPPGLALVAFDPAPTAPGAEDLARHPGLENARLLAKARIRDRLNDRLPEPERCNWLHSSDHAWGALEYLRLAAPERVEEVLGGLARRAAGAPAPPRRASAG
jgi:hypothetical protein